MFYLFKKKNEKTKTYMLLPYPIITSTFQKEKKQNKTSKRSFLALAVRAVKVQSGESV